MNALANHNKLLKVVCLPILFLAFLSMSWTDLFEPKPMEEPRELIMDFSNISLCAPIGRYKITMEDIANSKLPLAPKLFPKWQTNLKITSNSTEAKKFFNQGLFYLYAFNHAEADRSFKEAIRLDPDCAMCHWGVALGLGPNINMPMSIDNNEDAYKYSQKALALSAGTSKIEQALIQALTKRYAATPPEDRTGLDSIYADEMRFVSQRFREEIDVATLFVESLMDCMPWDYWLPDGQPRPRTREVLAVLDYIAEKDPNHPGACHYYIHAAEAVHPDLATPSADRLTNLALKAGHLVHMPSHIYIRTGRYNDAAVANQKAMLVDEDYIERCNIQGIYPAAYYPHNIHFLWFAASMEGRSQVSIDAARKLVTKTPKAMVKVAPRIERYFTIPYFALVRFGKWDEVLKEPQPSEDLPYATVMWQYAQGMAYANKGKMKKAKKALKKIEAAITSEAITTLNQPRFPTINLSKMAALVLKGEMAGKKGKFKEKVKYIKEAVAIQDGLRYSEPPYFYYPIRQSLGAALLAANQPTEAEKVYREDLTKFPSNGWSLFGLHKSLSLQDKLEEAKQVEEDYKRVWSNADVALESSVTVKK